MACVVCSHGKRAEIEAAAAATGADVFEVAVTVGVNATKLAKHMASHQRAAAEQLPPVLESPLRSERPARATRRAPTSPAAAPPAQLEPVLEEAPATSRSAEIRSAHRTPSSARERVERLVDSLQRIADRIESDPEVSVSAQVTVLRSLAGPLRLLGTFTGEIGASETRVASSPFYRRVRNAVVESLRLHPDAAATVIAALERVERGEDQALEGQAA